MNHLKKSDFDSNEEYITFLYFKELKDAGIVKQIIIQPPALMLFKGLKKKFYKIKHLKTKTKIEYQKKQFLINPHEYTADLKIYWANNINIIQPIYLLELNNNIPFIYHTNDNNERFSYFEIKPKFDHHNMTRLFTSRTQPWVYQLSHIYVQLIKPYDLMKSTFVPKLVLTNLFYKRDVYIGRGSKRKLKALKGDKKFNWEYKTLKQYLNENNERNSKSLCSD